MKPLDVACDRMMDGPAASQLFSSENPPSCGSNTPHIMAFCIARIACSRVLKNCRVLTFRSSDLLMFQVLRFSHRFSQRALSSVGQCLTVSRTQDGDGGWSILQ